MAVSQNGGMQVAELSGSFAVLSLLRLPQLLHFCLEVTARPRLEQQSDRRLVRAKQYYKHLQDVLFFLTPVSVKLLDLLPIASLKQSEPISHNFKGRH